MYLVSIPEVYSGDDLRSYDLTTVKRRTEARGQDFKWEKDVKEEDRNQAQEEEVTQQVVGNKIEHSYSTGFI